MKCPFVERECIKRECMGYANGLCFVEALPQKIDTLCNMMSRLSADLPGQRKSSAPLLGEPQNEDVKPTPPQIRVEVPNPPVPWPPIHLRTTANASILSIDFGTALSKVAIRPSPRELAVPVPVAQAASDLLSRSGIETYASGNAFVEDSIVYIDDDRGVVCGNLARQLYIKASTLGNTRPAIQNLKQFLISGGNSFAIHESHFPGSIRLTTEEILAIFLGHLFHLAEAYSRNTPKLEVDVDAATRNFSIPVWDDQKYREEVKAMMKRAISVGYCLDKWLKDELVVGVPLKKIVDALREAQQNAEEIAAIVGADVTEPVAVGYSRASDIEIEPGFPGQVFVVDIGAGSTDFALLTISREKHTRNLKIYISHQGGVGKGVGVWDNALRALVRARLREVSGATDEQPEFQIFLAKLDAQLRGYKERIMSSVDPVPVDVSPVLSSPITVSSEDLEGSKPVKDAVESIRQGFTKYISEVLQNVSRDKFDPSVTEFLVTGGGSFIPSIVKCIRECTRVLGSSYERKVQHRYLPAAYDVIPNFANVFPMLAVSIGSTEPEYPKEQMMVHISRDPGPPVLSGYYTKGV